MALIQVTNATVEYPIFSAGAMSLRKQIVALGTGGTIAKSSRNIITVRALDDVSFTLRDGDRVGLVGHNGAGKSTLLRTLAGIYHPIHGQVKVEGSMSSILQLGAGLDRDLSGYENIIRMAMIHGTRKAQAEAMVPDIEEFTELGDFLSVPVHTYSAGMLTRLTFAVATALKPDILLIDEVIGAGDASFQDKARLRLEGLVDSAKILVLASHDAGMIAKFCNRTMSFEHGRLIKDQPILKQPPFFGAPEA